MRLRLGLRLRFGGHEDRFCLLGARPGQVDGQAHGAAHIGGEAFVAGIVGFVTVSRDLDIGHDADGLAQVDGHHHTDTAGRRAFVNLGEAGVDIGHDETVVHQHGVGVDIHERELTVFDIAFGNAQPLVTGAKTEPVVEALADPGVNSRTGTQVGYFADAAVEAVGAEVHAAACAAKPLVFVFFLSEGTDGEERGQQDKKELVIFHSRRYLVVLMRKRMPKESMARRSSGKPA